MTGPYPGEGESPSGPSGPSLSKDPWSRPDSEFPPPPAAPAAPSFSQDDPYRYGGGPTAPQDDPYRFGPPSAPPPPPSYGSPYPPPPPGYSGYPGVPQQNNGMAIAGLVLGIIGLVLCWIPFFIIPVIVLGIIFSAIGIAKAKTRGNKGKGLAIAGLVCSILAVFGQVAVDVYFISEENKCADQFPRGTIGYDACMDNLGE